MNENPSDNSERNEDEVPPRPQERPANRVLERDPLWVRKIIHDTWHGFLRSPVHICVSAFVLVIPSFFNPGLDFTKLFKIDAKGTFDYSYLTEHSSEIATAFVLALFANAVALAIAYHWANAMRLDKRFTITKYFQALATVPRVLYANILELLIILGAFIVTLPFLALLLVSKFFLILWIMIALALMMYMVVRWEPKFDYFKAGMGLTDEPSTVLLHEWWNMPKWLWQRFFGLMVFRLIFSGLIAFATIIIAMALKGVPNVNIVSDYLVELVWMFCISTTAVAFVRGRDEWAELTIGDVADVEPI